MFTNEYLSVPFWIKLSHHVPKKQVKFRAGSTNLILINLSCALVSLPFGQSFLNLLNHSKIWSSSKSVVLRQNSMSWGRR